MNIRFKTSYLVLLLSVSVFFSCKKDDTTTPTPPEEKPALFDIVQGKWAISTPPPARVSNLSILTTPKASMKVQDMGPITSVEFFKDSSCLIVFNYIQGYFHKLSVKDSTTFNFGGSDDMSDIKVAGDSISFTYVVNDEPVTVTAAKVADLILDQDKKSLVNEWLVTHEEDGDSLYTYGNNNGTSFPEGTQIYFQLTAAGTFAEKIVNGDEAMALALNWKLDPDHSDIIKVYSPFNDNMSNNFVRILSLTESSAKIELVSYVEVDNNNNGGSGKVSGAPDYEERATTLVLTKK